MDQLKKEIRKIFNIRPKCINKTRYNLEEVFEKTNKNMFDSHEQIENIENICVVRMREGSSSRDTIFKYLCLTSFNDLKTDVVIYFTDEPEIIETGYNITFTKEIMNTLENMSFTNNLDDLVLVTEYIDVKIEEILKERKNKIEGSTFLEKVKNMNINEIRRTAMLKFLDCDYTSCINLVKSDIDSRELLFLSKIMLGHKVDFDLLYYSEDSDIYLRRLYFILSYSYIEDISFSTLYNMLSAYKADNEILKAIVELELAIYLNHTCIYKRRIPLSLFYCLEVFNRYGLKELALKCYEDMESFDVNERVLKYCKSLI